MDPRRNPYTPGAGARPDELAGRDEEIAAFEVLLARLREGRSEQSQIITGLRGVGKTVLLNTFEDYAEEAGFLSTFHELTPESALPELLARDVQRLLRDLKPTKKVGDAVRKSLSALTTFKLTDPSGFELTVDPGKLLEQPLTDDFTEILLQVGYAAREKGTAVVLFLDEIQFAKEPELRALISALHRTVQRRLPLTVAAAGLPHIPGLAGAARSYAERLFRFPRIGALDAHDARAALSLPAQREGAEYEQDAIERVLELTRGYPFYIQEYGRHIWNVSAATPITVKDVEVGAPQAEAALDQGIYEARIQRATQKERRYLRSMAELGEGPYKVGSVAKAMGSTTTALSTIRQKLLERGLIYATEDYGYIDFTVPRFDEFMRRHTAFRRSPSRASRHSAR